MGRPACPAGPNPAMARGMSRPLDARNAPHFAPGANAAKAWRTRWPISTERLALFASLFFALACNLPFLASITAGQPWAQLPTWLFAGAMLGLLFALHLLLLSLVLHRWIARPLLTVLLVTTAFATYYMKKYGVFLDPTMLRNVMNTDPAEAGELLNAAMLPHLLMYAVIPLCLLWRVKLVRRPWPRALMARGITILAAVGLSLASVLVVFKDFSALMRTHKEIRYLATPINYVYSSVRVLTAQTHEVNRPRLPIGTDAKLSPSWLAHKKPALFVIAVGETARAANWGLNGYERQTTPELAGLGVLNFRDVRSCGTNTETSLPCMFASIGRRDYDEDRIRGSDSLLHLMKRAGFSVLWRDNQAGCKGVCADLPEERLEALQVPDLCGDGRCLDGILLRGLDTVARDAQGNLLIVLHMLGNHGPAYHKRYPDAFRRFTPTCDTGELRQCSRQEIVNAYDNALLYTDSVLAHTIAFLKERESRFDTAMLYVSDHGESLGENGLYLHGLPYAIAPSEQTRVPMVWWMSPDFAASFGLDGACLSGQAGKPWTHDNLFHTVLGLLQVETQVYDRSLDISAACRR